MGDVPPVELEDPDPPELLGATGSAGVLTGEEPAGALIPVGLVGLLVLGAELPVLDTVELLDPAAACVVVVPSMPVAVPAAPPASVPSPEVPVAGRVALPVVD